MKIQRKNNSHNRTIRSISNGRQVAVWVCRAKIFWFEEETVVLGHSVDQRNINSFARRFPYVLKQYMHLKEKEDLDIMESR